MQYAIARHMRLLFLIILSLPQQPTFAAQVVKHSTCLKVGQTLETASMILIITSFLAICSGGLVYGVTYAGMHGYKWRVNSQYKKIEEQIRQVRSCKNGLLTKISARRQAVQQTFCEVKDLRTLICDYDDTANLEWEAEKEAAIKQFRDKQKVLRQCSDMALDNYQCPCRPLAWSANTSAWVVRTAMKLGFLAQVTAPLATILINIGIKNELNSMKR